MATRDLSDDRIELLSNMPPTSGQSRSVVAFVAVLLIGSVFLAPFANRQLPRLDGFIPALDATILVTDFMTSALLFAQFSISNSRAVLALACGYLFSAFIIFAHALSFPGAFSPTGNLGGNDQTTLRLYFFWHLGLPVALLAYVWLRDRQSTKTLRPVSTTLAICLSVAGVFGLASGFVWLSTAADEFLPTFRSDPNQGLLVAPWIASFTILICTTALAALSIHRRSVLDQWLMTVAFATIVELALTALFGGPRFSLGFYTGRIFSVVTSTVVLVILLAETTRLYARLAQANTMLQRERNNKLMNFEAITAAIAHEIRQPLTAIMANTRAVANFLGTEPPDHHEIQEALNDIIDDSQRASEAINGIRALFKTADQSLQLIDINWIVLDVLQSLRGELNRHGVTANSDLMDELPLIKGNGNQLHQVVHNLVQNAIDAMATAKSDRRELKIRTGERANEEILLEVEDLGPGIDAKDIDGIFDAFVTTKAHGTGLGLAICRMIVDRHSGRLSAMSDGATGAQFHVVLPIKHSDGDAPDGGVGLTASRLPRGTSVR